MKLAALFSDHMVLQQGVSLPVWGWAGPGEDIVVRFMPGSGSGNAEQVKMARAGKDGKWLLRLDPLKASAVPSRLAASSSIGNPKSEIGDVLVGEVWLCSGQSNMQWVVRDCVNAAKEIAAASHPDIRMFTAPAIVHMKPPEDVKGTWSVCSPGTVADFSAVGYFFGRELQRSEGVPIGLVNSSWGGTRVEAWTGRDTLVTDELCRREVKGYEKLRASLDGEKQKKAFEDYQADPNAWVRSHVIQDPGNEAFGRGWADPAFDDSAWPGMDIPAFWQRRGVQGNGVLWFRRRVKIPAGWAGRDLVLHLGARDKHDTTYFNNVQAGKTGWETENPWTVCRMYRIPGRLVRAGENLIAVRVYSYRNMGGMSGPKDEMRLVADGDPQGKAVELAGTWRFAVEHDFGIVSGTAGQPEPLPNQNSPYALFDNMIAPLVPYAIRGAIWYQGESNVDHAYHYRARFPLLIRNWREAWGLPFPFLFVQLANYLERSPEPVESGWAELREAQFMTLREPNTGMAVTIDIGDAEDVHPKNKQDVGRRLAFAAQAMVYGRAVAGSGPIYRSSSVRGGAVRVKFDHADGGLVAKDGGVLKGFAVAGGDRKFVWADATIEGDTVAVRSGRVKQPAAARYAWAENPAANLYNGAGLPASPFRTDDWPGMTWPRRK